MVRPLAVVGIVATLGCSHHGSTSDLTPDQYATQVPAALCTYEVRCGLFADQASCLAYDLITVDANFAAVVASGKTTFDPDEAQACLDATTNLPCDQTTEGARVTADACTKVVTGTGSAGDACSQNAECASASCEIPDCQQECCQGMCIAAQAPAGLGEPCVTRMCDTGLQCSADTQTCAPLSTAGTSCMLSDECAYGLGCANGTCKMLPLVGEPCPDQVCAELGATCDASSTCAMVGLPGAACMISEDCSPYVTCDETTDLCEALPTLGEPCTTACSDGSFCNLEDGSGGSCTAPGPDGATCKRNAECANEYCDDNGMCMTPAVCI
jgi:hypothetical protein